MNLQRLAGMTGVAAVAAFSGQLYAQGEGTRSLDCAVPALQQKAPTGTTITGAKVVEASGGNPKYCQVDGHTATPGNEVDFRLGLPERWNGKYYFVGVGGLGGTIGRLDKGLARGYASASTNTGHTGDDPNWGKDRAKEIDYGHRGTHVTAVAGKELTTSFYGRAPEHAYFDGCSNGGRQALMEVQRYPADFDGIIAGDPATGTPMQAGRALVFQKLLASPASYLTIEKVEALSKASVDACDAVDGLRDGLVSDPKRCHFKPESIKCAAGTDGPTCLTDPQLAVVKQIYEGARLASGETYAYGFPFGHEGGSTGWRAWTTGNTPPETQADNTLDFKGTRLPSGYNLSESNFRFLALENDDPAFSWRVFNLDRDLPRMKTMTEILSPLDADLRPYKSRGGKIILYHGLSDPAISSYGTIDYYNKVANVVGGTKDVEAFARLYLVPGMHHCSGGPGPNEFDMLIELENWVEKGKAPAAVLATHRTAPSSTPSATGAPSAEARVDRTRPLCPYPQMARYLGTGSIDEAANFRCEAP